MIARPSPAFGVCVAAILILTRSTPARADRGFLDQRSAGEVREEEQAVRRARAGGPESYAYQLLIPDGLFMAVTIAAALSGGGGDPSAYFYAGFVGWVGVSPIVHMAHGNYSGALWSIALRVGAPLVTAWIIGSIFHTRESYEFGAIACAFPISFVDAALLAYR